jgi:hypothetical protein
MGFPPLDIPSNEARVAIGYLLTALDPSKNHVEGREDYIQ